MFHCFRSLMITLVYQWTTPGYSPRPVRGNALRTLPSSKRLPDTSAWRTSPHLTRRTVWATTGSCHRTWCSLKLLRFRVKAGGRYPVIYVYFVSYFWTIQSAFKDVVALITMRDNMSFIPFKWVCEWTDISIAVDDGIIRVYNGSRMMVDDTVS